jgi:DNA-binding transcriptional MocR family regulator
MQKDADTAWIEPFARGGGPRYVQVADAIERAVADGRLRPGDRLPAQRRLAGLLGVDLTTVTRAYEEAKRRHLIEARGAQGSYVAHPKVELAQPVDLGMNIPPPPRGVDLDELLRHGLSQVLVRSDADALMTYHLGGGGKAERAAGARWLEPALGRIDSRRVVACPGAQAALAALILALTGPGEAIAAEPLVYSGLRTAAAQLGRRVATVAADEQGMRPDALERAWREDGVRLVYLNPTLQNPTTRTMPAERRRELAAAAARCGLEIVEDDPYWPLADDAPAPLAAVAPERVHYVATLSKCLTPGLRTAYVLPCGALGQERFLASLRSFALMSSPLVAALAAQWVHDGSAAQLLAGVQAEARARQDLARQLLAGAEGAPGGIHVWQALPDHWTCGDLARAARAEGLAVAASDVFNAGANPPNAIRVSLGGVRERADLAAALRTLARLLARRPGAGPAIVV